MLNNDYIIFLNIISLCLVIFISWIIFISDNNPPIKPM